MERIRKEFGRLDLLVQNAAISNTRKGNLSLQEYAGISRASNASREVVRVALLGPDGPTGTFTRWEDATISW